MHSSGFQSTGVTLQLRQQADQSQAVGELSAEHRACWATTVGACGEAGQDSVRRQPGARVAVSVAPSARLGGPSAMNFKAPQNLR